MSFSAEIRDFIGGFQAGYRMMKPSDEEIRERRRKEESDAIDAKAKASNADGSAAVPFQEGSDGSNGTKGIDRAGREGTVDRSQPAFATDLGEMAPYAHAISTIESGGKYGTVGPADRRGDRPYGRYPGRDLRRDAARRHRHAGHDAASGQEPNHALGHRHRATIPGPVAAPGEHGDGPFRVDFFRSALG